MKNLWFLISLCFWTISGFGQAQKEIDSLKLALAHARQDQDRVMILSELSYNYVGENPDTAFILAKEGLALARKIHFLQGEVKMMFHLARTYRILGNIPNSMRISLKGLQIAENLGFRQEEILFNYNIGALYQSYLNDPPRELYYFKKASQLNRSEMNNAFGQYWDLSFNLVLGRTYMKFGELDSAASYFDKVLSNIQRDPTIHPPLLMFMGLLQQQKKNYREAQDLYSKSAVLSAAASDNRTATVLFYRQATCYQEMGKMDSCIYYARRSLTLGEKINYQRYISRAATLLAQLYEAQNNPEALYYYKKAKLANDEVYGEQKVAELQRILTEEMQRQQEVEKQKAAYENRVRQYALLSGLAVVLLVAFLLYRNNQQKQKANVVLEKAYTDLDVAYTNLQSTLKELKLTQAQLIQSEKMASLGELTAGIAHEIQNPLNFVKNYSEVNVELLDEMKEEIEKGNSEEVKAIIQDLADNETKIHHHGQRADSIVRSMMQHSRTGTGTKEPTDLNALADEYLRLAYQSMKAKDSDFEAEFSTDFDETLPMVEVVQQDIGRALLNIINNAFQACAERGRSTVNEKQQKGVEGYQPAVKVTTKILPLFQGEGGGGRRYGEVKSGEVEITISDNGPGIPEAIKDKIFQPFFTTKPTGQGTGLGLSLAYDIVKAHRGELRVESKEGEGTLMVISLSIH